MKKRAPKHPPAVSIDGIIHTVRGERVILDADLAKIYGVETRVLNQAVRRNRDKFPPDFLLELTNAEASNLQHARKQGDTILRSQIVILRHGHHLKHQPFAFTEHGALMVANILNSPQATQMSVFVRRPSKRRVQPVFDDQEQPDKLSRDHAIGWASVSIPTPVADVEIGDHLLVCAHFERILPSIA